MQWPDARQGELTVQGNGEVDLDGVDPVGGGGEDTEAEGDLAAVRDHLVGDLDVQLEILGVCAFSTSVVSRVLVILEKAVGPVVLGLGIDRIFNGVHPGFYGVGAALGRGKLKEDLVSCGGQLHTVQSRVFDLNGVVELVAVTAGSNDLMKLDLQITVVIGSGIGIGVIGVALGDGGESDAVVSVQSAYPSHAVLPDGGGMNGVAVVPLDRDGMLFRGNIDLVPHLEGDGEGILVDISVLIRHNTIGGGVCLGVTVVTGKNDGGIVLPARRQEQGHGQEEGEYG